MKSFKELMMTPFERKKRAKASVEGAKVQNLLESTRLQARSIVFGPLPVRSQSAVTSFTTRYEAAELDLLIGLDKAAHDPGFLDIHRTIWSDDGGSSRFRRMTLTVSDNAKELLTLVGSRSRLRFDSPGPSTLCNSSTVSVAGPRVMKTADLGFMRVLGQGASGKVYLVRDQVSSTLLALKVVAKIRDQAQDYIHSEQRILRRLAGNEWFLGLESSWHDADQFYFAMPYIAGGDLYTALNRCKRFEPERARFYIAELLVALDALHGLGIIHRDIKPGNILIAADGHLVLGDFGLSKMFDKRPTLEERTSQPYWPFLSGDEIGPNAPIRNVDELPFIAYRQCGTPFFMSPEQLLGLPYSFGIDAWSSAVVLFWMLVGRPPWNSDDGNSEKTKRMIIADELTFKEEDNIDPVTQDFLQQMLKKYAYERIGLGDPTKEHPYFAGIDWEKIARREATPPWTPVPNESLQHARCKFTAGEAYTPGLDPHPSFAFTSARVATGALAGAPPAPVGVRKWLAPLQDSLGKLTRSFSASSGSVTRVGSTSAKKISHEKGGTAPADGRAGTTKTNTTNKAEDAADAKPRQRKISGVRGWMHRLWIPEAKWTVMREVNLMGSESAHEYSDRTHASKNIDTAKTHKHTYHIATKMPPENELRKHHTVTNGYKTTAPHTRGDGSDLGDE